MSPEPRFPICVLNLSWAWRSSLGFYGIAAYDSWSRPGYLGGDARAEHYVALGSKDTPLTDMMDGIPGYGPAISHLVEAKAAWPPTRAKSNYRPWVLPAGGLTFDHMEEALKRCRLANVGPDRLFEGRDLLVHVQPYVGMVRSYGGGDRQIAGLGLVGIEVMPCEDWSPVPQHLKAGVEHV